MARRATLPALLAVLALVAIGGGAWLLAGRDADGARSSTGPAGAVADGRSHDGAGASAGETAIGRADSDDAGGPRPPTAAPVHPLDVGSAPLRAFGRVVDERGIGIADAELTCFRDATHFGRDEADARAPLAVTARTDGGGRFELAELPADTPLGLEARHADFAPVELSPFTVSAAQSTDLGDLVMSAGLLLIGNVLAADGRPLAGASVRLSELGAPSADEGGPQPGTATTGTDGEYRFDHLAARQFTVEARATGFARRSATLALQLMGATSNARQDFTLLPADAAIAGQVLDHEDRPVPEARLRLSQRDRNAHDYLVLDADTDAQGRFRFDEVAAGLYQLELLGSSHYLPQPLSVRGGDQALVVRVQLAKTVKGTLHGATGAPRDFRVSVRPAGITGARLLGDTQPTRLVSGAEPPGTFEFTGLRPGTYRFEIRAAGYAATPSADVILGDETSSAEVLIELASGGSLDGRIAPPAPGVAIELRPGDYDPAAPMESVMPTPPIDELVTRADAEGVFRLEHVPAGRYVLTARAPATPPLHLRDLDVVEGGRLELGVLELPRGGVIFGNVLGRDGEPSVGVRVTALATGRLEQAVTDATGAFRLPALPAGDYELRAVPANLWEAVRFEAAARVTLREGEETPVLLTFTARAANPH